MFKLLKRFDLKQFMIIVLIIGLMCGQVYFELKIPDYMSQVTQLVQTEGSDMGEIWKNGLYMMIFAFASLLILVIITYFSAYIGSVFSYDTRKSMFDKVQELGMEESKAFSTASLITRTTNDISQVEMFLSMGLMIVIKSPITAIWAISKILNKGMEWSIATAIAVAIMLTAVGFLIIVVGPKLKLVQKLTDKINNVTRENLAGIRVVRAFNAEKYQEDKFEYENKRLTDLQRFNQKSFAIIQPLIMMVMYFLSLAIYLIGANLITRANMFDKIELFGNMIVFSSYAMQVIMSFLMMAFVMFMFTRAQVSADRINEVLDEKIRIFDGNVTNTDPEMAGQVEFKNVSFKYRDAEEYVLRDISFKVEKGETIAFIGSTGSGKSTLLNLVPRFFDVVEGSVLVDGIDVKDYKLSALYDKFGYVPQKAVIFNLDIKDNVAYGMEQEKRDLDNIKKAVEVAQAKDFVENMDQTYDSMISRGGTNISGGQKQRLAIARAVARKPEIYIFDDTFSALDFKTERSLRRELAKYTEDATVMIVATRISTIMNADKIVVLEKGRMAGYGNHRDLLENCDIYKEIAYSQLSEEELKNDEK